MPRLNSRTVKNTGTLIVLDKYNSGQNIPYSKIAVQLGLKLFRRRSLKVWKLVKINGGLCLAYLGSTAVALPEQLIRTASLIGEMRGQGMSVNECTFTNVKESYVQKE